MTFLQASSDEEELQRLEADFSLNDVLLFRTLAERAMAAASERNTPRTSTDSAAEAPAQDARCGPRALSACCATAHEQASCHADAAEQAVAEAERRTNM